jgi:FkbM family methyltransferase
MYQAFHLLLSLFTIINPRKWGVLSEIQEKTKFDAAFSVSYSQAGEDLALLNLINKKTGFYIDIGAHHPSRFSVTRLLYQQGWFGINVDANPDIESDFRIHRKRDLFVNAAVGNFDSQELYRFYEPAFNTTDKEWMQKFLKGGNQVRDVIEVPGISLRRVFDFVPNNQPINLLNIDIEGADFEALLSLDLETLPSLSRPEWVLIESTPPLVNVLDTQSIKYLTENSFEIYCVLPMATLLRNMTIN